MKLSLLALPLALAGLTEVRIDAVPGHTDPLPPPALPRALVVGILGGAEMGRGVLGE